MTRSDKQRSKVVVVLDDETRLKGFVDRLDPRMARLQLKEVDLTGRLMRIQDLDMRSVLAVFFVRDLGLLRTRRSTGEDPRIAQVGPGDPVRLTFLWGEIIEGIATSVGPRQAWLELAPHPGTDRADNLACALVAKRAVARLELLGTRSARGPSTAEEDASAGSSSRAS